MDELVDWLRDRPYYEGQIADHRVEPDGTPSYADLALDDRVRGVLGESGIDRLYTHQTAAIEAVREGSNVVLATPTASGKTLAYAVPAFERALDHGGRTLYIAPTNALIADQRTALSGMAEALGFGSRVVVRQYTGRLDDDERRAVRDRQPTVLLTTPDMLHFGILPHGHRLWDWFLGGLETVVVDEVHEFRGIFGSHVALLLRRLRRLCDRFDAAPQFVCCSATIRNPVEHASTVTGLQAESYRAVTEDASARGPTHWLWWNPPEYGEERATGRRRSSHTESMRLFADLVAKGHQTLVFTRARQAAERYAELSADRLRDMGHGELAAAVAAYQAALPRDRRDEIEAGLADGSVPGAWTTNALALGVDLGGLDAVILDGYPGTRMATRQQAGRAGRGTDPSLVCVVAGEDQLDQYLAREPDAFFERPPERAVVNPGNDEIRPDHLRCAARENWLSAADAAVFGAGFEGLVADLEADGELERRETRNGTRWTLDGGGSPQHEMNLRRVGDREVRLVDERAGDVVGRLGLEDAMRDAHPGAIYHHQGQRFEVTELDLDHDRASLSPTWADYHTKVLYDTDVTVEADLDRGPLLENSPVTAALAEVTVTRQVTGYERRESTGEPIGRVPLDLPPTTLRTTALYFTVPSDTRASLESTEGSFPGAIHGAEHALISLFPTRVLCDRGDVGGLSTPHHPHTGKATVFVYDGHPGGVGLSRAAYDDLPGMLADTAGLLDGCDCESGCPACVQSPQCGNANDPLDKGLALELLDTMVRDGGAGADA